MSRVRVIDRGDFMEIVIAELAEEVVTAIKSRMLAEGLQEMERES